MKFDDYHISPDIKANLKEMGLTRPTDIQFKAITPILKGEDVLAIAQTGTGKTAAFVIPVLHLLHSQKRSKRSDAIKCIVMVPTRELSLQITAVFEKIGRRLKVKAMSVFGGVEQDPQIAKLKSGVDVLVTTPGRMFDLVSQGHIVLEHVEIVVVDEADRMLDNNFIRDIRDLMKHLPRKRQTLFFSATIDEKIKKLAYSLVRSAAIRIQISPKDPVSKNVNHSVAFIAMDDKRFFLARLIEENPEAKILVFVRTKVRAERVCKALERVGVVSLSIHGDKEQKERIEVLKQFSAGDVTILVATDVSARGIDIPDVDLVVNYDLPDDPENYVHRVGRTGRGKKKGRAIAFCSDEERELLRDIENYVTQPIKRLEIPKGEYVETVSFHDDRTDKWKAVMQEIEDNEAFLEKKKKKKK